MYLTLMESFAVVEADEGTPFTLVAREPIGELAATHRVRWVPVKIGMSG
jgi:hypothetical protein